MSVKTRVFIADDDDLFRAGLKMILSIQPDMEVVGDEGNGQKALEEIEGLQPDLVLVDIRMPRLNGIELIKRLKKRYPQMNLLILTTFNEEEFIIEGLAHGACGYVLKQPDMAVLLKTIRSIAGNEYILPGEVACKLARYALRKMEGSRKIGLPDSIKKSGKFTKKELQVMELLAQRLTSREIAAKLFIGEGTIKNYLTVIYGKLGIRNRVQAYRLLSGLEE